MNDIFKDLIGVYVIIYLDDLLIFSENEADHEEHVKHQYQPPALIKDDNLSIYILISIVDKDFPQ